MPKGKRNYRIGGQKKLFHIPKVEGVKYEKTIKVESKQLELWLKVLQRDDKIRISRAHGVTPYKLTFAFRGYASVETINKINEYFSISRRNYKVA